MFPVCEVMYFVAARSSDADWYSKLFDIEITSLENPEHFFIHVGAQDLLLEQILKHSPIMFESF
jgi:hypothetical protein